MPTCAVSGFPVGHPQACGDCDPCTAPTRTRATEAAIDNARAKAEIAIEKILQGLESDSGIEIDQVQVDTRNFSNLNVEIFFKDRP